MGDIIDDYGGWDNLMQYTDEEGYVDFEAAYNDMMEEATAQYENEDQSGDNE